MGKKKATVMTILAVLGLSLLLGAYLELFWGKAASVMADLTNGTMSVHTIHFQWTRFLVLFLACALLGILIRKHHRALLHFGYQHRYLIGLALLALCVVLELSGSSIAQWNRILGTGGNELGTIFGVPRDLRSDEYAVFTPFAFSQE